MPSSFESYDVSIGPMSSLTSHVSGVTGVSVW